MITYATQTLMPMLGCVTPTGAVSFGVRQNGRVHTAI
ncbi:hypothetical protein HD594_002459 [Microbacterium thalassium]|uniref:Uncharacterized protein n=1 Tax=Microbacterium thalassium TaxID=362649 RepID=A0A7X0KVE6_9MICO|nr:hypothetical protein [Microbacterium thalassium]